MNFKKLLAFYLGPSDTGPPLERGRTLRGQRMPTTPATRFPLAAQSREQTDACRVETEAPGWRCIWLLRHGVFLAYPDTGAQPNAPTPAAVAEETAEQMLTAIRHMGRLRRLVRLWLDLAHPRRLNATVRTTQRIRWWFRCRQEPYGSPVTLGRMRTT